MTKPFKAKKYLKKLEWNYTKVYIYYMYVTSAANIKYILFANSGILPDSEDRLLNPTWQRRPYS